MTLKNSMTVISAAAFLMGSAVDAGKPNTTRANSTACDVRLHLSKADIYLGALSAACVRCLALLIGSDDDILQREPVVVYLAKGPFAVIS